jgi:serine/threonine protein kinase
MGSSSPVADVPSLRPVRESVLEVDNSSWIVADKFIISLQSTTPSSGLFWSDGADAFYTISELDSEQQLPQTRPLSHTSPIKLAHDAGDANAAWRIGDAFLKVQKLSYPNRTREHMTLNYLHDPSNAFALTSSIPRVLYHNEFNGRYYLITTRIPGETLEKAWPAMDEAAKQACVDQVVATCKELARTENDTICGIDGGELLETWIYPFSPSKHYSHEALLTHCREIGMEEETFVLSHCDMGPTNVLVDLSDGCKVGIIDWEVTGFVPMSWIRTKFCVCGAMNFDFAAEDVERRKEWRERVQLQLDGEGFPEVAEAWTKLWENYHATCK